ncbi:unnamed protein product [Closterium sp. Yama58-4]|nr:unnamed protein product [Closterium sp. Yama58-4]
MSGTITGPVGTPYEGGTFLVDIVLTDSYPFKPPKMTFITKVWHPNVSSQNGAICLDILKDQWTPALTLKTALLSLQALLSSPEPDDPQDAIVAQQYLKDYQTFVNTARYWTEAFAKRPSLALDDKVKKLVEMGFPETAARGWVVAPGSARLLRHFQSRTLKQALVTTHPRLDVLLLNDQLGNFTFDSQLNFTAAAAAVSSASASPPHSTPTSSTPSSHSPPPDASALAPSVAAPSVTAASSSGETTKSGGALLNEAHTSPPAAVSGIDSLESARRRVNDFVETCKKWNLKPSQVLVVLGSGPTSSFLAQALQDSPFFICQMTTNSFTADAVPPPPAQAHSSLESPSQGDSVDARIAESQRKAAMVGNSAGNVSMESPSVSAQGTAGWTAWWKQLSEGTLHKDGMRDGDVRVAGERKQVADWLQASARFKAADMVELKGVVEELNGVSFRSSTFMHAQGRI